MISLTPIAVPMVDLERWAAGGGSNFPSRGWPSNPSKEMEAWVSQIPDDHLYFTFLAHGTVHELVSLGWTRIKFGADGYAVMSGSLKTWVAEINDNCSDNSRIEVVRRFYNAVCTFFMYLGLDRLWSGRYKKTLDDGTFIFTD